MDNLITPRTDALFGIFLQDMREIRERHPKIFGNNYFRFHYAGRTEGGYCLFMEPDTFPKSLKGEITRAFDRRLNQDLFPQNKGSKRRRKEINF